MPHHDPRHRDDPGTEIPGGHAQDIPPHTPVSVAVPPRWYSTPPPPGTTNPVNDRAPAATARTHASTDLAGAGGGDSRLPDIAAAGGETLRRGDRASSGERTAADPDDVLADRSIDRRGGGRRADTSADPDASVRAIARTVRAALVGTDLLRSGPAFWPFGHRARRRRAHNDRIAEEATRRRARLRETFDAAYSTTGAHTDDSDDINETQPGNQAKRANSAYRRPVDHRTRVLVIGCLLGLVAAVVLAMVWVGSPAPAEDASRIPDDPTLPATPESTDRPPSASGPANQSLPPRPAVPPSGVAAVPAHPREPVDPQSVSLVDPPTTAPTRAELDTPEGAMQAWLGRWCPFDYTDPFGTAERRAQPAMTDEAWATVNPDNDTPRADDVRASWEKTIAARESGRCTQAVAVISPAASRSATATIVIGAITRVITSDSPIGGQTPYVEQLTEVRIVRREPDGGWRVDLTATGG